MKMENDDTETSSDVTALTGAEGHMFEEDYMISFPKVSLSPAEDQSFKSMGFEDYQELAHKTGRICGRAVPKSQPLGGPPRTVPPGRPEPTSLPVRWGPTGGGAQPHPAAFHPPDVTWTL